MPSWTSRPGRLSGSLHSRHRAIEFKTFLQTLDREVPAERDVHVILDNSSTHKTPAIKSCFTHFNKQQLVEPRRALVADLTKQEAPAWRAPLRARAQHRHRRLDHRLEQQPRPLPLVEDQRAGPRADAEAHETAIREQTHASPGESVKRDQREQARERLEAASTLRDEYLRTFAELEEALEHRGELLGVLAAVTAEITDTREQTAGELGKRLTRVTSQLEELLELQELYREGLQNDLFRGSPVLVHRTVLD
jgi:hypothetical protein